MPTVQLVTTDVLDIAVERSGDPSGFPVVLLHGFPYDPRSFDAVAARLAAAGADVVVPYLRGYGPTRFRSARAARSGRDLRIVTPGIHRPCRARKGSVSV